MIVRTEHSRRATSASGGDVVLADSGVHSLIMNDEMAEPGPLSRREALRAEAARLIAESGYHGASMQELADNLGFTKANIYYYYRSKEELLFDILTFADAQMTRLLDEAERRASNPLDRIALLVEYHVTWYLEHPAIARVAFRDWNALTGEALAIQRERRRRHGRLLLKAVEDCRDAGILPPEANVVLIANFINGAVGASNSWFRPEGEASPLEIGRAFARYAVAIVCGTGLDQS